MGGWLEQKLNEVGKGLEHVGTVIVDGIEHAGRVVDQTLDRWMGGGERTIVATSIARAVPDKFILSSVATGVSVALHSDGEVLDYVLEYMSGGMGVKAERMHAYAKSTYTYGTPYSRTLLPMDSKPQALTLISEELGFTVVPTYFYIGPPNLLHVGWETLVASHGYNSLTNQLGVLSGTLGTAVYLQDMVVVTGSASTGKLSADVLMNKDVGANAGVTPFRPQLDYIRGVSPNISDMGVLGDRLRVDYVYTTTVPVVISGVTVNQEQRVDASFYISLNDYSNADTYYQVGYKDALNKRKFWSYKIGTGTHPALDSSFDAEYDPLGNFFPFVYLRHNGAPASTDHSSSEYRTSRKLVKYLGMDYDTTVANINSNPDIPQVVQAMLMFAVPAVTSNPIEQRYLFDFFEQIYFEAHASNPTQYAHAASFGIADKRYRIALNIPRISRTRNGGVLGPVGNVSSYTAPYAVTVAELATYGDPLGISHVYRKQVSPGYYDEVIVSMMTLTYAVSGGYVTVASGTHANLLIPIDLNISKEYGITDREVLYARSMHYVFNALSVTYVHWYQTQLFSFLLLAAAIILSVVSLGESIAAYQALGLSLLAATSIALVIMIINTILIRFAVRLFIKAVGKDLALATAVALALYGAKDAIQAGGVQGAPMAKDLLVLSSNISNGVGESYAEDLKSVHNDREAYNKLIKERNSELESANALLERTSTLSPFVIFGEKPEDYFNRTVHAGNIGVTGIDMCTSYVDIALTLPKLSETI